MATYVSNSQGHIPVQRLAADSRTVLMRQVQARLSGAVSYKAACNPVDLNVPSFSRVVDIDFDDDRPVKKVRATKVTDDDLDW